LPKTEEILKITNLMSHVNFQAVMKSFGQSTDKKTEENISNNVFHYYLYSIVNKYFKDEYRHGTMIGTE